MLAMLLAAVPTYAGVKDGLHNLSVTGPGQTKAVSEGSLCEFCHISHSANPDTPLWSRPDPTATYIPYSSSTAIAQPGQPTGTSLLCLSCHDGTIALGQVINRGNPISMAGGRERMTGKGLTGTDLRDDHPISFEYSGNLAASNGELAAPGSISSALRLDENGELQCTTCHDPHDSPYPKLLHVSNVGSQICVECHQETGWSQTSHSLSAAAWNGSPPNPWHSSPFTTVSDNGCQNCHVPHNEAGGPRLLIHAAEEDNCVDCHNGNVASDDIDSLFNNRLSSHPVDATTLVHDPTEPAVSDTRHVECADCHDPHATRASRAAGDVPFNVRGVTLGGIETNAASETYEICLRCHGDSPNQPVPRTLRQDDLNNLRLRIQPNSPSFAWVATAMSRASFRRLLNNRSSTVSIATIRIRQGARAALGLRDRMVQRSISYSSEITSFSTIRLRAHPTMRFVTDATAATAF
jgi:predicted CXXCH cytochrome family protein